MIETDIRIAERLLPSDPLKLTTGEVIRFVEKRRMEGVSDQTIRHTLTRIKTLLKHRHKMGDIYLSAKIEWPSLKASEPRMRYLTETEEKRLLETIEIDDYRY